jgi:hypothetical protein
MTRVYYYQERENALLEGQMVEQEDQDKRGQYLSPILEGRQKYMVLTFQ